MTNPMTTTAKELGSRYAMVRPQLVQLKAEPTKDRQIEGLWPCSGCRGSDQGILGECLRCGE